MARKERKIKKLESESDKVLDSTKDNISSLQVDIKPIDLEESCKFCMKITETLLTIHSRSANVKQIFIFDKQIYDYIVTSDELRIKQLFLNFLSNSVKFTRNGSIPN